MSLRSLPASLPFIILLLSVWSFTTSCGARRTFDSPYDLPDEAPPAVSNISDLVRLLEDRSPDHPLFWSRAGVRIEDNVNGEKARFDATLMYREPDGVRVRGSHMLLGLVFQLIIDGEMAFVHLPRQDALYGGTLDELVRMGGIVPLPPQDVMSALLVSQDLRRRLVSGVPMRFLLEDDYMFLIQTLPDARVRVWKIRRSDGLVQEVVQRSPDGPVELRVRYRSYRLEEGREPLPDEFEIEIAGGDVEVRLDVDEYITNPEENKPPLRPEVVTILPRNVQNRLPLSMLGQTESVLPAED